MQKIQLSLESSFAPRLQGHVVPADVVEVATYPDDPPTLFFCHICLQMRADLIARCGVSRCLLPSSLPLSCAPLRRADDAPHTAP